MTREEVYDKCTEKIYPTFRDYKEGAYSVEQLLPKKAIDAIIDCAVEEAVERMKGGEQE